MACKMREEKYKQTKRKRAKVGLMPARGKKKLNEEEKEPMSA